MAAAAVVLVLGSGYVAVPPLRAAVDDVAGTFSGWLDGVGGAVPGRPLGAHEQAPDYFRDPSLTADPRVIAQAGGYKLYAAREADGDRIDFDLGDTGVGLGFTPDDFRDRTVIVLGPGAMQHADERGHPAAPPANWTAFTIARHGLDGWLPPRWRLAASSQTPRLGDPREIMTAATFTLGQTTGRCTSLPAGAIAAMAPTDALVSVQERGTGTPATGFPPRPVHFGPVGSPGVQLLLRGCLNTTPPVRTSWIAFSDGDRRLDALVVLGNAAGAETQRDAFGLLDRLHFDQQFHPAWRGVQPRPIGHDRPFATSQYRDGHCPEHVVALGRGALAQARRAAIQQAHLTYPGRDLRGAYTTSASIVTLGTPRSADAQQCGLLDRTVLVGLHLPAPDHSASMSQGAVYVSRVHPPDRAARYQVWGLEH